jgi:hypothetical protein
VSAGTAEANREHEGGREYGTPPTIWVGVVGPEPARACRDEFA